jgi:uncharacterized protein (TIGR02391 family)
MPRSPILDPKIKSKLAKKLGKKDIDINKMAYKRGEKLGISSEAALIILAKENDIGTSTYLRSLDPTKQAEVRDALPSIFAPARTISHTGKIKSGKGTKPAISKRESLKLAIEYLIEDQELLSRCQGILIAPANFDIAINQATLVLEDRIRKRAEPTKKLVGENLVNTVFKEDLSKTILRVASNEPDDQRGFTQILRGVVPAFRNKTHHHIIKNISREEAMRVCGFVDVLLRVVDNSVKVK